MKTLKIIVAALILHTTTLIVADESTIGNDATDYSLILEKLKKNPSAKFNQRSGWSIVSLSEGNGRVIWFFSPKDHDAHPAMMKKTISVKGGHTETVITTLCDAGKKTCDDLIKQFEVINEDYQ